MTVTTARRNGAKSLTATEIPAGEPSEETIARIAEENSGDAGAPTINISRIAIRTMLVPLIGTSPLIVNRFSEKAKKMMLAAQQGVRTPKVARNPEEEFQAALYRTEIDGVKGFGFPVTAFKAATVGAARFYGKDVKMTELRQFVFMRGVLTPADPQQLVQIIGEPRMREDTVRLAGPSRSADLRFRPEFPEWSATLEVSFVASSLNADSVLSLIEAGGMGIGVGEWRPEKRGEFGTFRVDDSKKVDFI